MCIMMIEPPMLLDRTSRIKLYKYNARSRLFCRIAKRSIVIINLLKTEGKFLIKFFCVQEGDI